MSTESKTLTTESPIASEQERWLEFGRMAAGVAHELRSPLRR